MNRLSGMRLVNLESVVISTYNFHAPLNFVDHRRYIEGVNSLAEAFELSTKGAIYMGDEMSMGRLKSKWCIIVKGYESSVDLFLKEVKKVTA